MSFAKQRKMSTTGQLMLSLFIYFYSSFFVLCCMLCACRFGVSPNRIYIMYLYLYLFGYNMQVLDEIRLPHTGDFRCASEKSTATTYINHKNLFPWWCIIYGWCWPSLITFEQWKNDDDDGRRPAESGKRDTRKKNEEARWRYISMPASKRHIRWHHRATWMCHLCRWNEPSKGPFREL